jgi:predicted aspartyl protease
MSILISCCDGTAESRPQHKLRCEKHRDAVKRSFQRLLICVILLMVWPAGAEQPANSGEGSLRALFTSEGFGGAPLQRRFGNHLFVPTTINHKRTTLMIDTGCPYTLIDKSSVGTLGLTVEKTKRQVGRVFGWSYERFGATKINTLTMGNCTLANVPAAVADESEMNYFSRLPHIDGLFGAYEMVKFGVVIDCARQMLYISPRGASAGTSQKLATFLESRGFTRIPLRLTSDHHFDVEAAVNGHPLRLVVDTGAGTTLVAQQTAIQSGVAPRPNRLMSEAQDGRIMRLSTGVVKELTIGNFKIENGEVELGNLIGNLKDGLLGEEHLTWNFAVIDIGGMSLFLRHPDTR